MFDGKLSLANLILIVAIGQRGEIGLGGKLPWHLPTDLKSFKDATLGHPVVMGRKTFEANGRPLPSRRNIVVSQQPGWQASGAEVASTLLAALALVGEAKAFLIGGGQLYEYALAQGLVDEMLITRVEGQFKADTFFSPSLEGWRLASQRRHLPDERNAWAMVFERYVPEPK